MGWSKSPKKDHAPWVAVAVRGVLLLPFSCFSTWVKKMPLLGTTGGSLPRAPPFRFFFFRKGAYFLEFGCGFPTKKTEEKKHEKKEILNVFLLGIIFGVLPQIVSFFIRRPSWTRTASRPEGAMRKREDAGLVLGLGKTDGLDVEYLDVEF